MTRWTNPRCADCGLFCSWLSDSYVNWGSGAQLEPDDPEYLCHRCAKKETARYLAEFLRLGLRTQEHRPCWVSPPCYWRAVAIARGMRKHGTTLPVRHQRAREEHQKGRGSRVWCACGWATPWLPAFGPGGGFEIMRDHLDEVRVAA